MPYVCVCVWVMQMYRTYRQEPAPLCSESVGLAGGALCVHARWACPPPFASCQERTRSMPDREKKQKHLNPQTQDFYGKFCSQENMFPLSSFQEFLIYLSVYTIFLKLAPISVSGFQCTFYWIASDIFQQAALSYEFYVSRIKLSWHWHYSTFSVDCKLMVHVGNAFHLT